MALSDLFAMIARLFGARAGSAVTAQPSAVTAQPPVVTADVVQPLPVSPSSASSAAPQTADAPIPAGAPVAAAAPGWLDLCRPLTEASEGCVLIAYPDPASGGDPWTCGYGATGPDVTRGTVWTQAQADSRLTVDLGRFADGVDAAARVPLTAAQKAALVDFSFNVGLGNLRSSTLLKLLNAGNYAGAAEEFVKWTLAAGKTMPGLVTRRARERSLFLTGSWT